MFMGTIWLEGVMKKLTLLTCAAFFALTGGRVEAQAKPVA